MKIGDTIDFAGPSGRLVYKGRGKFLVKVARKEPPTEWNMKKAKNIYIIINILIFYKFVVRIFT